MRGKPQNPKKFFWNCPPKTAFLRGQFFPGYGTVQPEKVLHRCRKPVAVHKTCQRTTADSIHKDSIRWSGLQVQRIPKPEPPKKQRGQTEKSTPHETIRPTDFPQALRRIGAAAGRVRRNRKQLRFCCRPERWQYPERRQQPEYPSAYHPKSAHHRPVHAGKERFGRVGGKRCSTFPSMCRRWNATARTP